MSVASVITALQGIHAAISGVQSAPTSLPASITADELPFVFSTPGPGSSWARHAQGLYRWNGSIVVRCYVKPISQGRPALDGYSDALTLYDLFGAAYLANQTLGLTNTHIGTITDRGIRADLMWGEAAYWGFEFVLEIGHKWTA